ncbi:MAG: recombinase RecA [Synergistaceae bacterium]|nr:recombinase RecA [Synergistaceae bacterium]MBQ3449670.1 recombinase RecA [Synergistaceae bacterium]MBQ3694006.1 recombinase RecA [Synergistaceae bacterium]MBQ9629312.1 recombinase RecA [Synergistaceae bacterium]MBR0251545.1 recombinase RecA [Synergistaceae bacterium]
MAKAAKKPAQTREEILAEAIGDIRSKFGEGAIMRLGETAKKNVEVIPSGVLPLDVALGIGGYPKGRIVEIFGPEGSGKTTIALCAVAEAQKAGGIAAFIDAEHALDPRMAMTLGVDVENLYLAQPDSGEQALYILDQMVRTGAVDIVVVDSVAALTPQAEIDGRIGESQLGLQARLMSYSLRRLASIIAKTNCIVIFINQLRAMISTGYAPGPSETTTGGRALKFYASVRLEVRRGKKLEKGDITIGHELYLKVVKNKLAPPFRIAHASLIYGKGIPTGVAVVDMAIDYNVINKKGSWLTYKGETLGQGKETVAKLLSENKALQDEIVKQIMTEVGKGIGFVPETGEMNHDDDDESVNDEPQDAMTDDNDEGILEISDSDSDSDSE